MAIFAFFGILAVIPFFLVYGTWSWGVVVQKTWAWFVVPSFNLQPLTFHQAIAISVFIALFFLRSNQTKVEKNADGNVDWSSFGSQICLALILPWVALFFNWITYLIFM